MRTESSTTTPARGGSLSRANRLFWNMSTRITWLFFKVFHRIRFFGKDRIPIDQPVIFIANHQSHFDPPACGLLIAHTYFSPMARASLFRVPVLASLIRALNAIPLERGKGDLAAIRTALGALAEGRTILLFPEGRRSDDGSLGAFRNGALLVQRKSGAVIVPLAIEGAFNVWPRSRSFPRPFGRLAVMAGDPIPAHLQKELGPDVVLEGAKRCIERMRLHLRADLRDRTRGAFPPPSVADRPYWESEADSS
jgi:1-acyl-sn-glycerol-3-phosphate acyltransferase